VYLKENHINGVMVSVLASSAVDRGSEREVFLAILHENQVPMIF
jgi:hypothetical protein